MPQTELDAANPVLHFYVSVTGGLQPCCWKMTFCFYSRQRSTLKSVVGCKYSVRKQSVCGTTF